MKEESVKITTRELWTRLFQASSVETFFYENTCELPELSDYINELCKDRNEKPGTIIRSSNIENSYGHRIFSGTRHPSRDTVLMLAFGFGLSPDDTQQLLKVARQTPLHPKVRRDAVIAFCLHQHKTIVDTQQILDENGLPLMGVKNAVG